MTMLRVGRFLGGYLRYPSCGTLEEEVWLEADRNRSPASFIRPRTSTRLPGWIVLHGITVPGRHHLLLKRFAHSLACSGAAVVIPEVEAWRRLRLDGPAGDRAILGAADFLDAREDVTGPYGLVGFSFGATQALTSSTFTGIRERLHSVVSFGGYCDFARTIRFMMTGEHEWKGLAGKLEPDPYGRWIVVANYLTAIPELAHMTAVADAAHELASLAGEEGVYAGDPRYDEPKRALAARLTPDEREVWSIIAAPSAEPAPLEPARELAAKLADAAARVDPRADPRRRLREVSVRVVLAHGREDLLVPYTESLRLHEAIPSRPDVTVTVTRLFAHSSEADRLGIVHYPREVARYFSLLNRALLAG